MKILTKEEEAAHYNATVYGGLKGGLIGLAVGGAAVYGAHLRFPTFRHLTLPMKTFLVTSSGTFSAIIQADKSSRNFETARNPANQYKDKASDDLAAARANESSFQRFKDFGRENRYPIVTGSWVASIAIALGLVGRNPYLSTAQKLVQARVYAQGLTLAVLLATAAFEVGDASKGKGRWETVKILDPNDPEHKHMIEKRIHHEAYEGEDLWRDMVATEERKIAARKQAAEKSTPKKDSSSSGKSSSSSSDKSSSSSSSDAATSLSSSESSTPKTSGSTSPAHYQTQDKGKSAKDKHVQMSKGAGKIDDYAAAEKMENENMERQEKKQRDAREGAVADGAKVKDRGEYGGK